MSSETDILKVLTKLEYGVYVVTIGNGDNNNAFTASWLTQVASSPPMIVLSIHNKHQSGRLLSEQDCLAVNLLSKNSESVARTYYGPAEAGYRKLDGVNTTPAPETGCPLIPGAVGYLDCRVQKRIPAGNHTVFMAEVVAAKLKTDCDILTGNFSRLRYAG